MEPMMKRAKISRGLGLGAASALALSAGALVLSPVMSRPVEACGGFWCSQTAPVNQSAEQIIFVDNPDDTVTAIIQINYVGPSEKFAWVIPIPGDPEIAVSSNTAFARLDGATAPQYTLERHVEGTCKVEQFPGGCFDCFASSAGAAPPSAPTDDAAAPAIMVINQGSVGPYDYATIAVNPALPEPADAAIEWFTSEGYDLTGVDAELLGPYLADGLNLLAFRLTKSADAQTGSIRPVMLTYHSELPMIPIRPTAVAAQPDMGIRVWVSADKQAIPSNYRSLVINEALIDWFNYTSNYDQVVTAAANEAGGQGFVTELAGDSKQYADGILAGADEQQLAMLAGATYADGIDAIFAANNYYRDWDGWRDAIQAAVTLPAGASFDDFGRNPDAYRGTAQVDIPLFFETLRDDVVGPVLETQRLIASRPYLTRLYSTMSSDEMTVDPAFDYNPDLADISNLHVAQQYIECTADKTEYEAPWRIELPQGGVIRGEGGGYYGTWPIALDALPANLKIVQLSTSGAGEVLENNSDEIGTMLYTESGMMGTGSAIPAPPATGMMIGGDQVVTVDPDTAMLGGNDPMAANAAGAGGGGSCSVTAAGLPASRGSFAFGALGLLTALGARRRRRG